MRFICIGKNHSNNSFSASITIGTCIKRFASSINSKGLQIAYACCGLRNDHNVSLKYGEDLKCYGTDRGGSREGRRNFVESTNYVSKDDGSNRCRIRYNIEGGGGRNFGFVFAEVSDKMNAGEFVYILVQDRRTGGTMTILDNRAAIRAGLYGQEGGGGMDALAKLLGGGK